MGRRDHLDSITEITADQGGYLTAAQAARMGVPHERLAELVHSGDLRRVRRGVYATREAKVSPLEDTIAAWLSTEQARFPWERTETPPGAVVSHRSAAGIWELGTVNPGEPDLTVQRNARQGRGIRFHRVRLGPEDWVWWQPPRGPAMPVTTPARTIVDLLIDGEEPSYLERATNEAAQRGIATARQLRQAARRRRSRHGALIEQITRMAGA